MRRVCSGGIRNQLASRNDSDRRSQAPTTVPPTTATTTTPSRKEQQRARQRQPVGRTERGGSDREPEGGQDESPSPAGSPTGGPNGPPGGVRPGSPPSRVHGGTLRVVVRRTERGRRRPSCHGTLVTMTPGRKSNRALSRRALWLCSRCSHQCRTTYSGMKHRHDVARALPADGGDVVEQRAGHVAVGGVEDRQRHWDAALHPLALQLGGLRRVGRDRHRGQGAGSHRAGEGQRLQGRRMHPGDRHHRVHPSWQADAARCWTQLLGHGA